MKMAKKLIAVLLAGVLALSVLTACSGGSAGPLTKDTVTDYMLDMAKVAGLDGNLQVDSAMEATAQKAVAYLNETASADPYKEMDVAKALNKIMEKAENDDSLARAIGAEEGYYYFVNFAVVESYRTELFNQGQTALVAATLIGNEHDPIKMPETVKTQSDEEEDELPTVWFAVAEGTVNGKKCMVAVFRRTDEDSFGGGNGGASQPTEKPSEGGASSGTTSE